MSKFDRVLSDDEVDNIVKNTTMLLGRSIARSKDFIFRVEQTVLEKLSEQEPAGYVAKVPFDADYFKYGDGINFYKKESHLLSEFSKATPTPLYAHPCVSPARDKTACVSENRENDTQTNSQGILDSSKTIAKENLPPLPEPHCKHGGGIGYFDSYSKEQMIEYAKSAIDHHRTTKNHIADMRKKVPEGWRLVPDQLNNEMAQALRLGSRKDYPSDLLCEVRYTALLAAAPKYTGK